MRSYLYHSRDKTEGQKGQGKRQQGADTRSEDRGLFVWGIFVAALVGSLCSDSVGGVSGVRVEACHGDQPTGRLSASVSTGRYTKNTQREFLSVKHRIKRVPH
jgi:hypothetical protein